MNAIMRAPKAPTAAHWSDHEIRILRGHARLADFEIAGLLRECGYDRTEGSVFAMRRRLKLPNSEPNKNMHVMGDTNAGWPVLRGTQEGRDRQYARMLQRALVEKGASA